MRLELVKRSAEARFLVFASPFIAIAITVLVGAIFFAAIGVDPGRGVYVFFIEPISAWWSIEQLLAKATPLILIGAGLSLCFLSNNWNIGAEGQFIAGALAGSILPVVFYQFEGPLVLPLMLVMGFAGGAFYGLVPAALKTRFGASEILTSLMLVYIAQLFLDWMVRGPWRDPASFGFPKTRTFNDAAVVPTVGPFDIHAGLLIALVASIILFVFLKRTLKGFEVRISGTAPRAATFAGVSNRNMVLFVFAVSGGLAGLAGIIEVAGVAKKLQPVISPGYGFAAIIVAFLGRLNPLGVVFAALLLALTYLGGEAAQLELNVTDKVTRVIQGVVLFAILACDTFILHRVRLVRRGK